MTAFSFDVQDAVDLGEGYTTLVGPPVETSDRLAIGDGLLVPVKGGAWVRCEVVEFPLVNLGSERSNWARVSVTGVSPDDVQIGSRASQDS